MQFEEVLKHLDILKDRLMRNPNFQETMDYFLMNLSESDEFLEKMSHRTKAEKVEAILGQAVKSFLEGKNFKVINPVFLRARSTPFYWGAFEANHLFCQYIYFDDIGMGLLALLNPESQEADILRITAQQLGSGPLNN